MIVTFISQCEKKALSKTRRVLDAFANRIGDNTWQTVITEDGLMAVKKLLSDTASKNTAVACHRIATRRRTELVWIVGNRSKFNSEGIVPVNFTESDIEIFRDNTSWKTLPLIQHASSIAGLFHDFGKANLLFQNKINPNIKTEKFEPYRHEWVSLRLFEAFVDGQSDEEWLNKLANGDFHTIKDCFKDGIDQDGKNPLIDLAPFARLVAWLIVSHHKLPSYPKWKDGFTNPPAFSDTKHWLNHFKGEWNSPNCKDDEQKNRLKDNWSFQEKSLPYYSQHWISYTCLLVSKAKNEILKLIDHKTDLLHKELFTVHMARLALMLSDHHFSSLKLEETLTLGWRNDHYKVYANTQYLEDDSIGYKQQLDEHLIGVSDNAKRISQQLPRLKTTLQGLPNNSVLENNVSKTLKYSKLPKNKIEELVKKFKWQDAAKNLAQDLAENTIQNGFFGLNMASTGCGKTLSNAKIMYAIGKQTGQIRFNVALGLRTLTLQTGQEFQDIMELSKDDLSVAVGGIAVKALFEKRNHQDRPFEEDKTLGSESADDYLNPELYVHYQGKIIEHPLYDWTKRKERVDKLLQPPVLVCTIDHLIPATEGIRGGQQIAPMLRLLTSDLILDEPDDFGLDDLPALCRLIHWSGMLGSRVLLSTATMPPDFVYACFEAYKAGWAEYAKANLTNWQGHIQCAWFDETQKPICDEIKEYKDFTSEHTNFVKKRITKLAEIPSKRLGHIVNIIEDNTQSASENMANTIFESINTLHQQHHVERNHKKVSIGLVRMANIDPMIAVAKSLFAMDAPENTCIHYSVYHSRFPLAIRSFIEEKLDDILKRKESDQLWDHQSGIGEIVNSKQCSNHIFIVLASPVAEVGRDHDYDWAVIEPSSVRSIVQIAGRVLRHRDIYPTQPNIHLLNKNIKGLNKKDICFIKPGFESKGYTLTHHDLNLILKQSDYHSISSIPKIRHPDKFNARNSEIKFLDELEHQALYRTLLNDDKGKQHASQWWLSQNHWNGELQMRQPFRQSEPDETFYLFIKDAYHSPTFYWYNIKEQNPHQKFKPSHTIGVQFNILDNSTLHFGHHTSYWFDLTPLAIYQKLSKDLSYEREQPDSLTEISQRFGEIKITHYMDKVSTWCYQYQLGIYQDNKPNL